MFLVRSQIVVKDNYGMGMNGMVIKYGKFAAYGIISTRACDKHYDVKYQGLNHSQNKEMFNNRRFNSKEVHRTLKVHLGM